MNMMDFRKTYTSKHSPQAWYNAWTSEQTLISPIVKIEADPRTGGKFILHAELENEIIKMMGIFLELSPPKNYDIPGNGKAARTALKLASKSGMNMVKD